MAGEPTTAASVATAPTEVATDTAPEPTAVEPDTTEPAATAAASPAPTATPLPPTTPTPVPPLLVPELTGGFSTIGGGGIDLGSLQGQDVILWFWAPW